jgi:hypothetical protein
MAERLADVHKRMKGDEPITPADAGKFMAELLKESDSGREVIRTLAQKYVEVHSKKADLPKPK